MRTNDRLTNLVLFALASIGLLFFLIPVVSLFANIPWGRVPEVVFHREIWIAMRVSLLVSSGAVAVSFVFGFPIAWIMARYSSPLTRILRVVVLIPMVLPPIVGGVVLLTAFGSQSPIGRALDLVGVHLPFTTLGAVLAVTFVSSPFMIISLESGLVALDKQMEDAALVLGASRRRVLWRIILPALGPAIVGGAALTWARALGEFGATIAFAGNRPGKTQTLPLAVYQALQSDMDRALMISALLILITLCLMIFVRSRRPEKM